MTELAKKINAWQDSGNASDIDEETLETYVQMMAVVDSEIKRVKGFRLRATQKLSALLLLANKRKSLIEVATGEGKTAIVLAVAIIRVLCGQKVHVVTSSSVLAVRDASSEDNLSIYRAFGVAVAHNCSGDVEERKAAYAGSQVVYRDVTNFQRDHLLDHFYQRNVMGDHTRKQSVIIDEVDSMLLDKGNNMLSLSHDIGDLDKLESVYAFIWQWINAPDRDLSRRLDVELIKSQILSDLYGSISKEHLKLLERTLSLAQVDELWDRLRDAKLIDGEGIPMNEESVDGDALRGACQPPFSELADRVRFLLGQRRDRARAIELPNFLKPFVALHAGVWVENAIRALSMEENQEYVVDVDRSGTSADVYPIVTILDKDTGTDQLNSQWDDALHQFLQIKHGCKLSMQSLKAVFVSNATYFKQYDSIYGLTGTLGTAKEKAFLQSVHGVDFLIMPTFKAKKFKELPPVVCANRRDWVDRVLADTRDMVDAKGRSALLVCETIAEVHVLAEALSAARRPNVREYTRDFEAFSLGGDGGKLEPGHVVVATNLASRGTDIKPSKALLAAGGLHVVLTYLPRSGRSEQQAFGRAARKGQPGSGRLVVLVETPGGGSSAQRVADMRVRRDAQSQAEMEEFYRHQILGEEACMAHFTELYQGLKDKLSANKYPKELQEVLLLFYVNKWALWLDRNETDIKTVSEKERKAALSAELHLHNFVSESYAPQKMVSLLQVLDQPSIIVKIGKCLVNSQAETSIALFDEVVRREPRFSESALYYKCAARVQLMHETHRAEERRDRERRIRDDLRLAGRAFDRRKSSLMLTARTIASVRRQERDRVTDKDAFHAQTQNFVLVYEAVEKSIHEMCGVPTTDFDLGGGEVELGKKIEQDLLGAGVLKGSRVRSLDEIPKKDLEIMSSNYGISCESLRRFLTENTAVTDVNQFEEKLKKSIFIRNKKSFWEILIKNNLIKEELRLVAIVKNAEHFQANNPDLKTVSFEDAAKTKAFLYSDRLPPSGESVYFARSALAAAVGVDALRRMLREGEAVELRRAVLQRARIQETDFLRADSVTLQQLEEADIGHGDALLIVADLEAQSVLERRGDRYFLATQDCASLQLTAPIYEQTVLSFVAVSFGHDLAYARVRESLLEDDETAIQIALLSNPHRGLLKEMFDLDVIERVSVDGTRTDIDRVVKSIYKRELELSDFKKILSEIWPISDQDANELYRELQSHKWLAGNGIESHDQRQSLTSAKFSHLAPALGTLFDQRLRLATMADALVETLESGRGLLATLAYPAPSLIQLGDEAHTQNVHVDELAVFALNGAEHILALGEKKYTIWMILSATTVALMGVCQIVAGVLVEICSLGALTHVGGGLIGEGVGDLVHGIAAFSRGEFSWKDYGVEKAVSVAISIATAGIGAYFVRGAQASRFGAKLIAADAGKKVAGKSLLREVGARRLVAAATRRVVRKAHEGVAHGVASVGVDRLAGLAVQALCARIAAEMAASFEAQIDASDRLQRGLADALGALGPRRAQKAVTDAAQQLIAPSGATGDLERYSAKISLAVLKQIPDVKNAVLATLRTVVQLATPAATYGVHANEVAIFCQNTVDALGRDLCERNYQPKEELQDENPVLFKEDMKKKLTNLLQVKVTEMLTLNLAKPVFQLATAEAASNLQRVAKKKRHQYRPLQAGGRRPGVSARGVDARRRAFAATVVRVLARRGDPALLAALLLEDAPLHAVGVLAMASAVSAMTRSHVAIVVHTDGARPSQRFEAKVDRSGSWPRKEVHVALRQGRFGPVDLGSPTHPEGGPNGHLFDVLSSLMPDGLDAKQFQTRLAEKLRTDVEVQRAVRRDWHLAATGGRVDAVARRLGRAVLKRARPPQTPTAANPSDGTLPAPTLGTPIEAGQGTPTGPGQGTPTTPTPEGRP